MRRQHDIVAVKALSSQVYDYILRHILWAERALFSICFPAGRVGGRNSHFVHALSQKMYRLGR